MSSNKTKLIRQFTDAISDYVNDESAITSLELYDIKRKITSLLEDEIAEVEESEQEEAEENDEDDDSDDEEDDEPEEEA